MLSIYRLNRKNKNNENHLPTTMINGVYQIRLVIYCFFVHTEINLSFAGPHGVPFWPVCCLFISSRKTAIYWLAARRRGARETHKTGQDETKTEKNRWRNGKQQQNSKQDKTQRRDWHRDSARLRSAGWPTTSRRPFRVHPRRASVVMDPGDGDSAISWPAFKIHFCIIYYNIIMHYTGARMKKSFFATFLLSTIYYIVQIIRYLYGCTPVQCTGTA